MANTSSAKKADRAAQKKRIFNLRRSKAMKDSVKDFEKLVAAKKITDAIAKLSEVYQAIDKAEKRGIIKANTAARMKSRLTKLAK